MMRETAAKLVYGIIGTLGILLGVATLFVPAVALPSDAFSPLTAHLVREQAAHSIFMGLIAFCCLWRFDQRRFAHFALLTFAALFSLIHWAEFANGTRPALSPIVNTLPFLALALTSPIGRNRSAAASE